MNELVIPDPRDDKARYVSNAWVSFNNARLQWLADTNDTRSYVSAKSTADTEVGQLPWKNKTTIPKLTQISDNLQSYYMAALMPNEDWFRWEGRDEESHVKANIIELYMQTKLRMSNFRQELEKMVRDWIIYGNCFGSVVWVEDVGKSLRTGEEIVNYIGPKLYRLSPLDAVINPRARSFKESPIIFRKLYSIGEFIDRYGSDTNVLELHGSGESEMQDWYRENNLQIDGFADIDDYLTSNMIEVIEYWGDIVSDGELYKNRKIIIADRSFTISDEPNPSWSGEKPFVHCGWRTLTDNVYGQSPLENLVGMQYRCDHLENLKADAFDQIVHPMMKIKGDSVEEFTFGPNQKIRCGIDGDVEFLRPDTSVLACNNEIAIYHQLMEQMAGSPKESMGFRTAGEKTAFEVSVLQQGADRMFQDKLNHFEEFIIRPLLNMMFEMLMRNLNIADVARSFNDTDKTLQILSLTKEDVVADGILHPTGAKYFADRNKRVQELSTFLQMMASPQIAPHASGYKAAKAIEEELGFESYEIIEPNIGVIEQIQTQLVAQQMQQQMGGVNDTNAEQPAGEGNPNPEGNM